MTIIKCPNCNEDISDKSSECVHCGYVLIGESKRLCEECGAEINEENKNCSNCGCPIEEINNGLMQSQQVEVTNVKMGKGVSKKKALIVIISLLVIIGIVIGAILITKQNAEHEAQELSEEYKENLYTIIYKITSGASEADSCGSLIEKVWYNSIYKENDSETDKYTITNGFFNDDFNDSLNALYNDSNFMKTMDNVEQNQGEVNRLFKKMKNPPEEWKEAYNDLKDYYDDYLTLTNLCIDYNGNYKTFLDNYTNAVNDIHKEYNKMITYLDY